MYNTYAYIMMIIIIIIIIIYELKLYINTFNNMGSFNGAIFINE